MIIQLFLVGLISVLRDTLFFWQRGVLAVKSHQQAQKMGLTSLWFECDPALFCVAFIARTNVLWMLCNRWNTCVNHYGKIRFRVSHIFREGIVCADKLANLDFDFHWYNRLWSSLLLVGINYLYIVFVNIWALV